VGIARLAMELSAVLEAVEEEGRVVVITRHRRGLAVLVPAEGPLMDDYWHAGQRELEDLLRKISEQAGNAARPSSTPEPR
jgi:prevent-host-death family protein